MKRCTKCEETKELGAFRVQKRPNGTTPLHAWCRSCLNTAAKVFMREHSKKPEVKARQQKREKEYNQRPERKAKHGARNLSYSRRPEVKARAKIRTIEHRKRPGVREKMNERSRRWNEKNPERVREIKRNHMQTPNGKLAHRLRQSKRRANMQGEFSKQEWTALVHAYGGRCAYCKVERDALSMDHVVPVSKGGRHELRNIVPACMSCNDRKSFLDLDVALARLGVDRFRFQSRRTLAYAAVSTVAA